MGRNMYGPVRGEWSSYDDEDLARLVGRRPAVPRTGLRADPPRARADRDGRRDDPFHRRVRRRAAARPRSTSSGGAMPRESAQLGDRLASLGERLVDGRGGALGSCSTWRLARPRSMVSRTRRCCGPSWMSRSSRRSDSASAIRAASRLSCTRATSVCSSARLDSSTVARLAWTHGERIYDGRVTSPTRRPRGWQALRRTTGAEPEQLRQPVVDAVGHEALPEPGGQRLAGGHRLRERPSRCGSTASTTAFARYMPPS